MSKKNSDGKPNIFHKLVYFDFYLKTTQNIYHFNIFLPLFLQTFCVWYLYCILKEIKLILGSLQQRRLM